MYHFLCKIVNFVNSHHIIVSNVLQISTRYFLLLNTVQGSKLEAPSSFGGILTHRVSVMIMKGALLLSDNRPGPFNYLLYNDPHVSVRCTDTDVALLDVPGFQLLEGIPGLETRVTVFQSGQLAFGKNLVPGEKVAVVAAKAKNGYAIAKLRYKGTVGNRPGVTFGLELIV